MDYLVEFGDPRLVNYLLKKGFDFEGKKEYRVVRSNEKDEDEDEDEAYNKLSCIIKTPLARAVDKAVAGVVDYKIVEILLKANPGALFTDNFLEKSYPLCKLCSQEEGVKLIIKHKDIISKYDREKLICLLSKAIKQFHLDNKSVFSLLHIFQWTKEELKEHVFNDMSVKSKYKEWRVEKNKKLESDNMGNKRDREEGFNSNNIPKVPKYGP